MRIAHIHVSQSVVIDEVINWEMHFDCVQKYFSQFLSPKI